MNDWKIRLRETLEPILMQEDPRPDVSAYADMPLCIFLYPPSAEFPLRQELSLLKTRLEQKGKRVTNISLMTCMMTALEAKAPVKDLVQAERSLAPHGHRAVAQTVHQVLSDFAPLDQIVLGMVPDQTDPHRDIVWLTRAGALYPCYRTSTLIEHFQRKLSVPGVLFYPGELEGPAGLRFMSVHEPEHNYRARIF